MVDIGTGNGRKCDPSTAAGGLSRVVTHRLDMAERTGCLAFFSLYFLQSIVADTIAVPFDSYIPRSVPGYRVSPISE